MLHEPTSPSGLRLLLVAAVAAVLLVAPAHCRRLPDIYWNSTNPIFRIDNTDHVVRVSIRDRINIVCPFYDPKLLPKFNSSAVEYSKIYRVSRWSYDRCRLAKASQLLGICNEPLKRSRLSLVFRVFTPMPNGLEFEPGRDYFFISTSDGTLEGLSNREDGLCTHGNMKLKFEIAPTDAQVETRATTTRRPASGDARIPVVSDDSSQEREPSGRPPPSANVSPTPVMYIIHTGNPAPAFADDYYYHDVKGDDAGSAALLQSQALVVVLLAAVAVISRFVI